MYNAGKGNKNKCFKCNELAEKLAVCVKDNEKLTEMMRDLRLESERVRLTAALNAKQGSSNGSPSEDEKQCEILKSQIIVYKEDFERERKDREKIHKEKEKHKSELRDAEDIIRKLTAELDSCNAREEARRRNWSENGHLSERVTSPQRYSSYLVGQEWRQEQERRGVFSQIHPAKVGQHLKNYITMIL